MALVSVRAYARQRGVSHATVQNRTVPYGGPIPVHGPKKQIDPVEAEALWSLRMREPDPPSEPSPDGARFVRARVRKMIADAKRAELELRVREGAFIARDRATQIAFAFARTLRDACQTWTGRVGPQLAAAFELDATAVTVFLDEQMRELLSELARERCAL